MHFDYPYYKEAHDGLTDEILGDIWERTGNVKLVGEEIPADEIITGTPKFGYRCLHTTGTSTDYAFCKTNAFAQTTAESYEFIFWVRPIASQAGNIITLLNAGTTTLTIGINSDRKITVNIPTGNISLTSTNALTLNAWSQCAVSFSPSALTISAAGTKTTAAISRVTVPADECRLGGFNGELDEFMYSSRILDALPSQPMQGMLNVSDIGGFGTGALGTVMVSSTTRIVNTTGMVQLQKGLSDRFSLRGMQEGVYSTFSVGSEVMFLDMNTGSYSFNKITNISNTGMYYTEKPIEQTDDTCLQAIAVPHFFSVMLVSGGFTCAQWNDTKGGGVIVFRSQGPVVCQGGRILTNGLGRPRTDSLQLTHGKLIDNFIINRGGGIFITCGGQFRATASSRIGATWDGSGKGGAPVSRAKGGSGGAGYGGAGGSDTDNWGLGGKGGVGGGGGGGDGATAGDAGNPGQTGAERGAAGTGGGGASHGSGSVNGAGAGGTQGVSANSETRGWASGGGGAGGNSGNTVGYGLAGVSSGSNVVIVANTISIDAAALSTGGAGGNNSVVATGGGGTGFCYLACTSMK